MRFLVLVKKRRKGTPLKAVLPKECTNAVPSAFARTIIVTDVRCGFPSTSTPNTIFDKGDLAVLRCEFLSNDEVQPYVDPDTVTLHLLDPDGVEADVSGDVRRVSIGVYEYDLDVTKGGNWWFRWAGVGTNQAAAEAELIVRESQFTLT